MGCRVTREPWISLRHLTIAPRLLGLHSGISRQRRPRYAQYTASAGIEGPRPRTAPDGQDVNRRSPVEDQRRTFAQVLDTLNDLAGSREGGLGVVLDEFQEILVTEGILVKPGSGYTFDSPFVRGWIVANTLPDAGIHLDRTALPRVE